MGALLALFSPLASVITSLFSNYTNLLQARANTQLEIEKNRARLAADMQQYNHDWEMAALAQADRPIRRISFFMFTAPFVVAILAPDAVHNYFSIALASMPDWYIKTYVAITGSVWGISSLKNILPQVINSLRSVNAPEAESDDTKEDDKS